MNKRYIVGAGYTDRFGVKVDIMADDYCANLTEEFAQGAKQLIEGVETAYFPTP